MGAYWLATLACLCGLLAAGHSAALSTPDTLMVVSSDEGRTTLPPASVTEETSAKADEVTTEGPLLPIKMTEMDVQSRVALRYAHTAVVAHVRNPAHRAQEATFRVLLPDTAFISGFIMTLDGKSYKAYVKEKEEAKQIYTDAVAQGIGAAHIAAKARDSNHFTVSVNVEAESSAVFNLTYEELLVRRNGVYNLAMNLHPGAPVPKLTVTVHIKESEKITALRVPEVRTGNEIDATDTDAQNSKAVIVREHDDREATITFSPDLEEQRRLMDIYAEKSKESQQSHRQRWYNAPEEDTSKTEGVLGQFVVQYDVDRPKNGEILVNDGYFVHFFAPSSLPPLSKHVVFVLDTSGSMMDRKIVQLREAMQTILGELNPGDYFSIVEFASTVKVYDLKEADKEPEPPKHYYYFGESDKPTTLVPPSPATPENVAKAKTIVSRLEANGGTNIASALNVAVDLIHKGVGWTQAPANGTEASTRPESTTPLSNDTPKEGQETATTVSNQTPKSTEPAKTEDKPKDKEEPTQLEPIIIFLTDGDPTVGETNPTRILSRLAEKNYGEKKASIFSLAFGEDADRKFLQKLSLRNEGFMRHIYEAADSALQLRDFYRQVSSPLLADVHFVYPPDQVKEGSVTKNKFRTLYAGSETVVAGRVADASVELAPHVIGICGVEDGATRKRYEIFPKVPVPRERTEYLPLERMWAYLTIKQLLDEKDAADTLSDPPANQTDKDKENTPEKKALAIALKYEFVTPLTSLVVVKPNATNDAVNAESVDKQNGPGVYGLPLAASGQYASAPAAFGIPGPSPQFAYKGAFSSAVGLGQAGVPLALDSAMVFEEAEEYSAVDGLSSVVASARRPMPVSFRFGSMRGGVGGGAPSFDDLGVPLSIRVASDPLPHPFPGSGGAAYGSPAVAQFLPPAYPNAGSFGGLVARPAPPPPPPPTTNYLTTPIPFTPPTTVVASSAAPDRLESLHLAEFPWLRTFLLPDADKVSLPPSGDRNTTLELEFTTDAVAPREAGGDAECARATHGAAGVCVYLTRCDAAKTITVQQYTDSYCAISHRFAGVCCPRDKVDSAVTAH